MTCAGDPSGTDSGHGLSWSGDESLHVFCRDMSGWPNPRQRTWVFDVFTSSEAVACKDETGFFSSLANLLLGSGLRGSELCRKWGNR